MVFSGDKRIMSIQTFEHRWCKVPGGRECRNCQAFCPIISVEYGPPVNLRKEPIPNCIKPLAEIADSKFIGTKSMREENEAMCKNPK